MIKADDTTKMSPSSTPATTHKKSSSVSTAQEEWTKIQDAAERRKIQNRNAQRKYRKNLKRRVEDLERQNAYMAFTSGNAGGMPPAVPPPTRLDESTPIPDDAALKMESSAQPLSPQTPYDHPTSMPGQDFTLMGHAPEWIPRHHGYLPGATIQPSQTLANLSPRSTNLSTPSSMDHDNNGHLSHESMLNLSSLTDYIQHNNAILEESMGSPTSSNNGDDMQMSSCNSCHNFCVARGAGGAPGGRTTLHLAAMKGYLPIVQMLLEKGMDVNARDNHGWTPLHLAVERGQHAVVKLLMERGADIYARV